MASINPYKLAFLEKQIVGCYLVSFSIVYSKYFST